MNPTKLRMFNCAYHAYDENVILANIIQRFSEMNQSRGWDMGDLPMPVNIEVKRQKMAEPKKGLFWTTIDEAVFYYLVFSRELTPEELNLWRMFVCGYFVGAR